VDFFHISSTNVLVHYIIIWVRELHVCRADACTHLNITYAVEREIEMCFKMEAKFLKMQER